MRPPHCTGENLATLTGEVRTLASFNEAPALHGGKSAIGGSDDVGYARFNEAPALHGGK